MNYRQMEIFHAIMQTGSVTSAARSLNLTQPAATKILRHAEDQLRFALFHRVRGRLVPTEDALAIYPDIERVFREVRAVQQGVEDVRLARRGALNVVAIPTLAQVALPQAIAAFLKERPDVRVSFDVRPRRSVMQSVATRRAEVGFAFLAPEHANVESRQLCRGELVCIVPRGHPLSAQRRVRAGDLEGQPLIGYSKEQGLRPLVEATLSAHRIHMETRMETSWITTTWALVDQGVGIALVDSFSQLGRLYTNVVVLPFEPATPIGADVLTPRGKPLSRVAAQFVEVAVEAFQAS